jgi:hypothetical protein
VTPAGKVTAGDHFHSPGSARKSRPPEQTAQTEPSGAGWKRSTMSAIGSSGDF